MSKKTYIVESYDPATRKIERVTVTHEVYNAYRRSGWNIADNNQSFFKHEIQMSSLIGGEDGGYDNFREFIGDPEAVDNIGGTHEKDTVHPIWIHDAKWQNGHLNRGS